MIDVAIVGGGPVGLFLASLLLQEGISVSVLEQRLERRSHSRAIGIHPPALEALGRVDCSDALIRGGVAIKSGLAYSNGRRLAGMDFSALPSRYPFVLSSPQEVTEAVLEARVAMLDAGALRRGARVTGCVDRGSHVNLTVHVTSAADTETERNEHVEARWVVVAAGARSSAPEQGPSGQERIRQREYRDSYVMGDFADGTGMGSTAVLFLERGGIVESFPLPGNIRRWVVRVDDYTPDRSAHWLAGVVQTRTGVVLEARSCSRVSSFRVRSSLLPRLLNGRSAVVGDAAHEVSPIGGQGMNLGWLDAVELAPIIAMDLKGSATDAAVRHFEQSRRRAARRAAFQSEINMMLGRPGPVPLIALRNVFVSGLARIPPVNRYTAQRFTMQ